MAEIIAALDLGTNTFHLLIVRVSGTSFDRLHDEQAHVKLGEGGITNRLIITEAFERGVNALTGFAATIKSFSVEKVKAVGTSALRSAKNGSDFVERVKQKTGISIEVIDGDKEAELIYLGARNAVKISSRALVMDIGGGSVEFILCDKNEIHWKKSWPIGAARLMAQFHHTDPISSAEVDLIFEHLDMHLGELKQKVREIKPEILIGTAGSFETFAALIARRYHLNKSLLDKKNFEFDTDQLQEILGDICGSTYEERSQNPDILPVRVNMIVVASILTKYVIENLKFEQVQLSTYALKEGLIFSEM